MKSPTLQTQGRATLGKATFDDALFQLHREYGDLVADFKVPPVRVNPDTLPLSKGERAQFRELAGKNADKPVDRMGDEYSFRSPGGDTTVLDSSGAKPRVYREIDGMRVEMPGVSDDFEAIQALTAELAKIEGELSAAYNTDREAIVQELFRLADRSRVPVTEEDAKEPKKLIERLKSAIGGMHDEAKQGNPPNAAPPASFEDLEDEAQRTPPDPSAAEFLATRLDTLDQLGKRLEENDQKIETLERERERLQAEITTARAEFQDRLRENDAQAKDNIDFLDKSGGGVIGRAGIAALIQELNKGNIRAAFGNPDELDLSRKLTDSDRTYIARGIGILLGDESIFTPDGTLVPTAFERRDKLRERLIQRKIMYDDGAINQLVLQQVIHDGANKALSTITREE